MYEMAAIGEREEDNLRDDAVPMHTTLLVV